MRQPDLWSFEDLEEAINQLQLSDDILFPRTYQGELRAEHKRKTQSVEALNYQTAWYTTLPLLGRMTNYHNQFSKTHARRTLIDLLGVPHRGGVQGRQQKYYVKPSNNTPPRVLILDIQDDNNYSGRRTAQLREQERQALLQPEKYQKRVS